ncbi:MAG: hypothetical protein D6730_16270 [Bacteroidetes bacterium]|nr:MAG: hypothetical protein D6730_16270 [Bacteroidota bacterium]
MNIIQALFFSLAKFPLKFFSKALCVSPLPAALSSCGILLLSLPLMGQSPSVKGSFPRDGAENLLRNAFVSARLILPNGVGVDPATLNDSTVRLYPAHQPDSLVAAFITTDERVKNLTLEPVQVLAPNTTYIFELTSAVHDKSGAPFAPYSVKFTTGDKALQKRITLNKPRLMPKEREPFVVRDTMAGQDLGRLVEVTTGELVTEELDEGAQAAAASPAETGEQASSGAVAVHQPQPPAGSEEADGKPLPAEQVAGSQAKAQPDANEETQQVATASPKTGEAPAASAPPAEAKDKSKPAPPPIPSKNRPVVFPQSQIARNGKLPIQFYLEKPTQVRLIIKTQSGKTIKRRGGSIPAGKQQLGISLKDLPPGQYTVYLIAGEHKVSKKIVVK